MSKSTMYPITKQQYRLASLSAATMRDLADVKGIPATQRVQLYVDYVTKQCYLVSLN